MKDKKDKQEECSFCSELINEQNYGVIQIEANHLIGVSGVFSHKDSVVGGICYSVLCHKCIFELRRSDLEAGLKGIGRSFTIQQSLAKSKLDIK